MADHMTSSPDKPTYRWPAGWRWRLLRWQARRCRYRAWLEVRRWPSPENELRLAIAADLYRRIDMNRP